MPESAGLAVSRMRSLAGVVAAAWLLGSVAYAQPVPTAHPLDPLTAAEIRSATAIVKAQAQLSANVLFPVIALHEPPKDDILAFKPGASFRRGAFVVVIDRTARRAFEIVVDLRNKAIVRTTPIESGQPLITDVEFREAQGIVRKDPGWQAAMQKRGITDFETGMLDPSRESRTTRWVRALSYLRSPNRNAYARPIEGVVAVVNLDEHKVDRVIDLGVTPIPPAAELGRGASTVRTQVMEYVGREI